MGNSLLRAAIQWCNKKEGKFAFTGDFFQYNSELVNNTVILYHGLSSSSDESFEYDGTKSVIKIYFVPNVSNIEDLVKIIVEGQESQDHFWKEELPLITDERIAKNLAFLS